MYFDNILPKLGQMKSIWELLFIGRYYGIVHKHYICIKK